MKSALVVQGGWEGHEPEKVSRILGEVLEENGFEVETIVAILMEKVEELTLHLIRMEEELKKCKK